MLLHEHLQILVGLFGPHFARLRSALALALLFFLQTLSVSKRVQSVIGTAHSRTNACQQDYLDFLARQERVSQDHCELALPERNVLTLRSLTFLRIKGSNTLFQPKEGLIDLSSLDLSVFVVALALLSSLTTSQINEQELSALLYSLLLNLDLSDGMTPT